MTNSGNQETEQQYEPNNENIKVRSNSFFTQERFQNKYGTQLIYASLFFFTLGVFIFTAIVIWLYKDRGTEIDELRAIIESVLATASPTQEIEFNYFFIRALIALNFGIILTFLCGILSIFVGYVLLDRAGGIGRETIPKQDIELIERLETLKRSEKGGVGSYVILSSLKGATGFFTKIGITGLPLATIALTIIFGTLAILNLSNETASNRLFDFANLTLGAFLASYVQKKEKEVEELKLSQEKEKEIDELKKLIDTSKSKDQFLSQIISKFPSLDPEVRLRIDQLPLSDLQNLASQLPQINSAEALLDWLNEIQE